MLKKKVYSTLFAGLCNRLEALPVCFAFHEYFGHEVMLDWPEFHDLQVIGARYCRLRPWMKLGAKRFSVPDPEEFVRMGRYRILIQKGLFGGIPRINRRLYLATAARLRLHPRLILELTRQFTPHDDSFMVGVHIRRGDYRPGPEEDQYDLDHHIHSRVPLWWYEYAMKEVMRRYGKVTFYLAHNGLTRDEETHLEHTFPIIQAPRDNPYHPKRQGHQAGANPVRDLFALACCPVIIGTPMSSFTHYPAHALGRETLVIQPLRRTLRSSPQMGYSLLFGKDLQAWMDTLDKGSSFHEVTTISDLPEVAYRQALEWL
ncbi:MAG: hypothetical protein HQL84_05115 [Magnetococcales bacterium]|nr:hypothetical protein [Magnetococcales bacterium]MBF0149410.1 hypothetical protein [Magnetococcales bacterium]